MDKRFEVDNDRLEHPIEYFYSTKFTGLCIRTLNELERWKEAKIGLNSNIKVRRVK